MNFTLCSSSLELRYPLVKGLPYTNNNMLESEPFLKVDKFNKKDNTQVSNHDAGKLVMSNNLMPQRLNGSYVGKNNLKEPGRKLEFVRTLLIDNYDNYTYNIYQELSVINVCFCFCSVVWFGSNGTLLMEEAERVASREHRSKKVAIISGEGTRRYYKKLGYELEGPYMVKHLV